MQHPKHTLTTKQYIVPFILVTSLFFLWGFARAILDVLNKHFQETLNVGLTQSALIQVVTYLGYFLMAIPAGMFINRFGYRRGVVFGLSLFALGAFLFVPSSHASTLNGFLGCLFIIACGLAFLETSANPYATELGPADMATSRLNLAQSFNGMGSFLAPMIVGSFLFDEKQENSDVSIPYMIMGFVVVFIAIVFSVVRLPEVKREPTKNVSKFSSREERRSKEMDISKHRGNISILLHNPIFMLGLAALLAYEVSEISINSYFVNFTTEMGWLSSSTASYILSLALVVFMLGRFIGSGLMMVVKAEKMLAICAMGSVVSIAMMMFMGNMSVDAPRWIGYVSLGFLILNYFFESIMFPTIFSLALKGLDKQTKTGSSLLMMTPVGGCGFLLVAYMADHTGPLVPFFIPLVGFLIVWVYARKLQLRSR